MKQIFMIHENFWKAYKASKKFSFLAIVILTIVLSSCSLSQMQSREKTRPIYPTTQIESPTLITFTPTPSSTPIPTQTPTEIKISSFRQIDNSLNLYIPVITTTQGPINFESMQPVADAFLYNNNIVTVQLGSDLTVFSYLNLDDLNNNGISNSDITIELTGRGYTWYLFQPINGAVYYHSNNRSMDFNSCLMHFPIAGLDVDEYTYQGMYFDSSGGSFCVITNEDRLAIVQFIENSIKENEDYTENLSFIVTVYSEILK